MKKGFTIIELIISIGIFALLLALVLANFHSSKPRQEFDYKLEKFLAVIKKAQNWALTGFKKGSVVPYYGLHAAGSSLIIFADDNPNNYVYDEGEALIGNTFDFGSEITLTAVAGDLLFAPVSATLYNSSGSRITSTSFQAYTFSDSAQNKTIYMNGMTGTVVSAE